MIIREQYFDNALISQENSEIDSYVEIVDSGTIEVREGEIDDDVANEDEGDLYNTNVERYSRTFSRAMILQLALDELQSAVAVVAVAALAFDSYSLHLLQNFKLFITNVITI